MKWVRAVLRTSLVPALAVLAWLVVIVIVLLILAAVWNWLLILIILALAAAIEFAKLSQTVTIRIDP